MQALRAAIAGLFALIAASAASAQTFPNIPANSVIGRLGIGTGPSQAIPFSLLVQSLAAQQTPCAANTIMAGPTSGAAAPPSCRALVSGDIPTSTFNQRVITTAGAVTVTSTDDQIFINKSVPATTTVNLPAASTRSARPLVVKDLAGIAAAFTITIVPAGGETIDGASTLTITINRASYTLVPISGTGWAII